MLTFWIISVLRQVRERLWRRLQALGVELDAALPPRLAQGEQTSWQARSSCFLPAPLNRFGLRRLRCAAAWTARLRCWPTWTRPNSCRSRPRTTISPSSRRYDLLVFAASRLPCSDLLGCLCFFRCRTCPQHSGLRRKRFSAFRSVSLLPVQPRFFSLVILIRSTPARIGGVQAVRLVHASRRSAVLRQANGAGVV